MPVQNITKCRKFIFRSLHFKIQIFSVKARNLNIRIVQFQNTNYIFSYIVGRRCGKSSYNRSVWKFFYKFFYFQISRSEIVSPLRYTMCFIYGYHRDFHCLCYPYKSLKFKPFGCNIYYFIHTLVNIAYNFILLCQSQRTVYVCGGNTRLNKWIYLVNHKWYKRRNYNRYTFHHQCRYLVTHWFSRTCRHYSENIVSF